VGYVHGMDYSSDAQPVFRGTPVPPRPSRCPTKFSPLIIIMNIFKINDIIIKMGNYEHQIKHFSIGVYL
jgi:hypothetical protein